MSPEPLNQRKSIAPQTLKLTETLRLLKPETLEVRRSVGEGLTLRCPECGEKAGVSVEPCFPISDYGKYLVFKDSDGEELGLLPDMASLPEQSRRAVEKELNEQHFIPVITRVISISREFHIPIWDVETNRGRRRFALKGRHSAHRMGRGRIYVRDAEGNGYIIPDVNRLDPASRRIIDTNV